jgi:hypothetical protein
VYRANSYLFAKLTSYNQDLANTPQLTRHINNGGFSFGVIKYFNNHYPTAMSQPTPEILNQYLGNLSIKYNTIRRHIPGGFAAVYTIVVGAWGYIWHPPTAAFYKDQSAIDTTAQPTQLEFQSSFYATIPLDLDSPKKIAQTTVNPTNCSSQTDSSDLDAPDQSKPTSYTPQKEVPLIVTSYLLGSIIPDHIWKSVKTLQEWLSADLVIIPHRYHNPTTLENSLRENEKEVFIDPKVRQFLSWERFQRYGHDVMADIRVPINNLNPLERLKKIVVRNTVIGHPTQAMDTKECLEGMPPTLWATGTISQIDPADNLTAKIAEFHHKYGVIVIAPDQTSRNVHFCKNGDFSDLNLEYRDGEVGAAKDLVAIWGDYHCGQTSGVAKDWATELTKSLGCEQVILHDFFDSATVNPHASNYERSRLFGGELEKEVTFAVYKLRTLARQFKTVSLVPSNHNDMLSRYFMGSRLTDMTLGETRILSDWLNAGQDVEMMLVKQVSDPSTNVNVLRQGDTIKGVGVGAHGDKGANGAKGSTVGFFKAGCLMIHGHTHKPCILGGVHAVGTLSRKKLGYNDAGLSSWKPSIAVLNRFGKSQALIYFDASWSEESN